MPLFINLKEGAISSILRDLALQNQAIVKRKIRNKLVFVLFFIIFIFTVPMNATTTFLKPIHGHKWLP